MVHRLRQRQPNGTLVFFTIRLALSLSGKRLVAGCCRRARHFFANSRLIAALVPAGPIRSSGKCPSSGSLHIKKQLQRINQKLQARKAGDAERARNAHVVVQRRLAGRSVSPWVRSRGEERVALPSRIALRTFCALGRTHMAQSPAVRNPRLALARQSNRSYFVCRNSCDAGLLYRDKNPTPGYLGPALLEL